MSSAMPFHRKHERNGCQFDTTKVGITGQEGLRKGLCRLVDNRYPEEYALRSKEVKELEEEEKAQSDTSDGTALGVFFPFLRY